ncbi:probable plastid-lipid-associated protein 10, chloroplastic isoform X1 [Olea europaea var. sylvestris]|uniref:probable plastid-lipid-associated protein 10, chloroplastic isoform X1 n=1 Tax=Olea europaea var. sylvestris TaxID=158386 RepID=UPI000C1D7D83|nr:probable plastid-lipid-associated protein 10, chloroplastic isoform X1 [Olea europaea var. sylvestris]
MDVAVTSSSPLFFSYRTPALSSSSSSISLPKAALAHNHRHVQTNAIRPKRTSLPAAISSSPISTATMDCEIELENRKFDLLSVVNDTNRGLAATPDQRSSIEEALVRVESFDAGEPVELDILDGTWRLQYTSAPDVLILFQSAETLPFLQVGQIFQKFECKDKNGQGIVRNVVRWSIPNFLEEHEGATLLVSAKFSVVSKRNIYLEFEEITIQNIQISEELQALIAPALLPRTFLSLQILQFIKTFRFQVPVNSPQRRSAGGLYYLSYLDSNMLLGRAVGGGGVFVFTRAHASI